MLGLRRLTIAQAIILIQSYPENEMSRLAASGRGDGKRSRRRRREEEGEEIWWWWW